MEIITANDAALPSLALAVTLGLLVLLLYDNIYPAKLEGLSQAGASLTLSTCPQNTKDVITSVTQVSCQVKTFTDDLCVSVRHSGPRVVLPLHTHHWAGQARHPPLRPARPAAHQQGRIIVKSWKGRSAW